MNSLAYSDSSKWSQPSSTSSGWKSRDVSTVASSRWGTGWISRGNAHRNSSTESVSRPQGSGLRVSRSNTVFSCRRRLESQLSRFVEMSFVAKWNCANHCWSQHSLLILVSDVNLVAMDLPRRWLGSWWSNADAFQWARIGLMKEMSLVFDRNVDFNKRYVAGEPLSLGRRSSAGKEFHSVRAEYLERPVSGTGRGTESNRKRRTVSWYDLKLPSPSDSMTTSWC